MNWTIVFLNVINAYGPRDISLYRKLMSFSTRSTIRGIRNQITLKITDWRIVFLNVINAYGSRGISLYRKPNFLCYEICRFNIFFDSIDDSNLKIMNWAIVFLKRYWCVYVRIMRYLVIWETEFCSWITRYVVLMFFFFRIKNQITRSKFEDYGLSGRFLNDLLTYKSWDRLDRRVN